MSAPDPFLVQIALESDSLDEYARRAVAYNASLARPATERELVDAWAIEWGMKNNRALRREILAHLRQAKSELDIKRKQFWQSVMSNHNKESNDE